MGVYPRQDTREIVTLIKKQCGHYGFIRTAYPQEIVSCTQCGMHEPATTHVPIIKKKITNESMPELSGDAMSTWIQDRLEL